MQRQIASCRMSEDLNRFDNSVVSFLHDHADWLTIVSGMQYTLVKINAGYCGDDFIDGMRTYRAEYFCEDFDKK